MNSETAEQMASGIRVGVGQTAACDVCGKTLRPNDHAEVIVLFTGSQVDVVVTRCVHCSKGELHPQTIRPCWLVAGRLFGEHGPDGRSRLILSGAEVIDRAGD